MAAQTRVHQQTEDLGTLRELVDLIKDPKKIIAAHEEARKQTALTDEVALKAAEAKDFIAKFNELQKNIKVREDKLAADQAAYEKDKADSDTLFKKEAERLAGISAGQLETKKSQDEQARQIIADRKLIEADKNTNEFDYAAKLTVLEKKAADDDKLRIANEAEAQRLAEIKAKWQAKAAKFKEAEAI